MTSEFLMHLRCSGELYTNTTVLIFWSVCADVLGKCTDGVSVCADVLGECTDGVSVCAVVEGRWFPKDLTVRMVWVWVWMLKADGSGSTGLFKVKVKVTAAAGTVVSTPLANWWHQRTSRPGHRLKTRKLDGELRDRSLRNRQMLMLQLLPGTTRQGDVGSSGT
jgi:hypothetical protein